MTYTNWTMNKSELNDEEYGLVADWCNENQTHTIEDMGEYYAVVKIPEPTEEEIKQARISELQAKLAETDYISCKITEALDYSEQADLKEKYADVIMQRREWRAELNDLLGDK